MHIVGQEPHLIAQSRDRESGATRSFSFSSVARRSKDAEETGIRIESASCEATGGDFRKSCFEPAETESFAKKGG